MELNHWYKLNPHMEDEFVFLAPTINREILKVISGKAFEVTSFEGSSDGGIYAIRFEGETKAVTRLEVLPQFKEEHYDVSWFYKDEWEMFTEVDVTTPEPENDEEIYVVHVSGIEPKEYGGSSGYMVGTSSWPQRFTLKGAKEHAEFVLKEEGSNAKVHIFRLETTAKVVTQVNYD